MTICELNNYTLTLFQGRGGRFEFDFRASAGEIWHVDAERQDLMRTFMRALATLEYPVSGSYRFLGKTVDFSSYRELLEIKKKIGYVSPRSALIRNRSVHENLALMKSYHENRYTPVLDENTERLSRAFGLEPVMNIRPERLGLQDFRKAILVRELSKVPFIFLVERPEECSGYVHMARFVEEVNKLVVSGNTFIFFTQDEQVKKMFKARTVEIREGVVRSL